MVFFQLVANATILNLGFSSNININVVRIIISRFLPFLSSLLSLNILFHSELHLIMEVKWVAKCISYRLFYACNAKVMGLIPRECMNW